MTYKRFHQITKGRSYTIMPFKENVPDTLRISKEKMIVFVVPLN
jgi:hypothetical protein